MTLNVVKHHRWWFAISSILVIISLISIFMKGFNFGIDYTGGKNTILKTHKFNFLVILQVIHLVRM